VEKEGRLTRSKTIDVLTLVVAVDPVRPSLTRQLCALDLSA
jgi:hypothetical protein